MWSYNSCSMKKLFEETGTAYPVWQVLEKDAAKYLQK